MILAHCMSEALKRMWTGTGLQPCSRSGVNVSQSFHLSLMCRPLHIHKCRAGCARNGQIHFQPCKVIPRSFGMPYAEV